MANNYSIVFHPKAEEEYLDSVKWYSDTLIGLGIEFVADIENSIDQISKNPLMFPVKKLGMREAVIKRFPFVIVYEFNKKLNTIYILAVYHTSRNPVKKIRKPK